MPYPCQFLRITCALFILSIFANCAYPQSSVPSPCSIHEGCGLPPSTKPGPICRYGELYLEKENIFLSTLNIPLSDITNFKNRIFRELNIKEVKGKRRPFLDSTLYKIGPRNFYKLAGLIFLPIWDWEESSDGDEPHQFQTIGFRIAIALWKINIFSTPICSEDQLIIAGIGQIDKAMEPIQNNFKAEVKKYTLPIKFSMYNELYNEHLKRTNEITSLDPNKIDPNEDSTNFYQGREREFLTGSTREFDFVFLEYNRFLDLATNPRFYKNERRLVKDFGLYVERSTIEYDTWIKNDSIDDLNSYLNQNWRSLAFLPYPQPDLDTKISEASIAFEDGKRCPPFWQNYVASNEDEPCYFNCQVINTIFPEMKKNTIITGNLDYQVGFNYGIGIQTENLDNLSNNFDFWELSFERPDRWNK